MKNVLLLAVLICGSILNSLGKNIDTLTALQQTKPYNRALAQTFPEFTYESSTDAPLMHLREKYKLDSVAGKGTDVEKALRLLAWFHDQVPHGDVAPLPVLTAENIIDTYRQKHYPQGCYGLAISMNEILLSMGYQSREVICFSNRYPQPSGGHVINTVFIPSLDKWIYIDPQENAYLKDEQGHFLSIAEVREHLVSKKPIVLNSTANYHGMPAKKEDYLDQFMGTHLYRIICPLNSRYNSETRSNNQTLEYVELLPYGGQEPPFGMVESQRKANYSVICYHTSNDAIFWQKPKH